MMIGEVRTAAIFVSLSICVLACDSSSLPGGSRPAIVSRSRFLAYRRLRHSGTLPALEADRQGSRNRTPVAGSRQSGRVGAGSADGVLTRYH